MTDNTPISRLALQHVINVVQSVLDGEHPDNDGDSDPLYTVRVTAWRLNVRQSPSLDGSIIGSLTSGQLVVVFQEQSGWGRISYQGSLGWISLEWTERL